MKKEQFKIYLNKKICVSALKYLEDIKKSNTKVKDIVYEKLEIAPYLKDSSVPIENKFLLFRLRTSMIDVKCNFSSKYQDLYCNLCDKNELQTQEHLISCETIVDKMLGENFGVIHSDLFMGVEKQLKASKLYTEILEIKSSLEDVSNQII